MKKYSFFLAIFLLVSFVGFSVSEIEAESETEDENIKTEISIEAYIPRFIISAKYPFATGNVSDFFYKQVENEISNEYKKVNGAIDIHLAYPFLNHLLVTGGLSFGTSNIFPDEKSLKVDSLFSMMHLRMGLGGGFRAPDWLQFAGGVEIGFFHLGPGSFYNTNSLPNPNEAADRTVMGFSISPFVGLDFLVSKTIVIGIKFDYQYGLVPKENNLETGKIEHFHNPGLSLGLGFLL